MRSDEHNHIIYNVLFLLFFIYFIILFVHAFHNPLYPAVNAQFMRILTVNCTNRAIFQYPASSLWAVGFSGVLFSVIQILLQRIKIRYKDTMLFRQDVLRIQFFIPETLPPALRSPVPEESQHLIGQIIENVPVCIINQKESNSLLFLKLSHEFNLMLVDILERKGICRTLLGIEADRNALDYPDIIHRTLLIEVGERDMPAFLVDSNRGNRGRHFLDQ